MNETMSRLTSVWTPGDGVLVCDLADLKRRNLYLGLAAGDDEIDLFDARLRVFAGSERVARIGGGRWASCVAPTKDPRTLCDGFVRVLPVLVTHWVWGVSATGEPREQSLWQVRGTVRRGVRMLAASVGAPQVVGPRVQACVESIGRCDVNVLSDLDDVRARISPPIVDEPPRLRTRWRCDEGIPEAPMADVCLFCRCPQLAVEGGADDVVDKRCDACGAWLSFFVRTEVIEDPAAGS